MSSDPLGGPICLLVILLMIYAWLAAVLAAADNLNEGRLRREAEDGSDSAKRLLPIAVDAQRVHAALRMALTLTGLVAAGIAAVWFSPLVLRLLAAGGMRESGFARALSILLETLCLGLVMVCFCGTLPRRVGENRAEAVARRALPTIRALTVLLSPLVRLLRAGSDALLRLAHLEKPEGEDVNEEDILDMVDQGSESGAIEENERELIENIFKFNNRTAEDVMTHRTDVTALWVGDDHDTVISTILETGFSRYPVYEEDMDDIIGVLNTRDYLLANRGRQVSDIRSLLRDAYFVPETVQADVLFRDMQHRKTHMAVVVDEYGGVSGIITMEDLLEEIVGDIYDEFDEAEGADIVQLEDNLWRVSGSAPLEEVAETLEMDLDTDEDYDTLGGLVFSQLTTIPSDGSRPELDVQGLHIRVEELKDHRVEWALVSKLAPSADEEGK